LLWHCWLSIRDHNNTTPTTPQASSGILGDLWLMQLNLDKEYVWLTTLLNNSPSPQHTARAAVNTIMYKNTTEPVAYAHLHRPVQNPHLTQGNFVQKNNCNEL